MRFTSGRAGTYHYWASTMGAPVPFRELAGAFVVDPAGGTIAPDRMFVITEWTSLTPPAARRDRHAPTMHPRRSSRRQPRFMFVINGLSWPATERLDISASARPCAGACINLSSQSHPMHLHGFYFDVDSLGDGMRDQPFDEAQRTSRRDAAASVGRHDDDDVDAGTRRELALPLPHHAPRLAVAPAFRIAATITLSTRVRTPISTTITTIQARQAWPG